MAKETVLVEQAMQMSEGYLCEDLLSMAHSEHSQNAAFVAALRLANGSETEVGRE